MGTSPLWDSSALKSLSEFLKDGEYQMRSSDILKKDQKVNKRPLKAERDMSDTLMPSKRTVRPLDDKIRH